MAVGKTSRPSSRRAGREQAVTPLLQTFLTRLIKHVGRYLPSAPAEHGSPGLSRCEPRADLPGRRGLRGREGSISFSGSHHRCDEEQLSAFDSWSFAASFPGSRARAEA